ncbi:MAG: class I SAM-dependent methyltransferase [Candidatus Pacebacteria bacterium]|nr:class I SAM-dependent methyltransferase [Candidatus Paceibacterota bacterium]
MPEQKYFTPKQSKIKELIRIHFLSSPLFKTKGAKEKVLDLGCGWGFYFKINPRACGIDFNPDCVAYLKDLGYKVFEGDIREKLPFPDNFFKWVISHDVLEHFELKDAEKIFDEVFRILETGAFFLILIPNQKGYISGLKLNTGHKHFISFQEILDITKGRFVPQKHFFYPLPKKIGNYFTHNKEVIVLKKINDNC